MSPILGLRTRRSWYKAWSMQGRIWRTFATAGLVVAAAATAAPAAASACQRDGAQPRELTVKEARAAVVCLINQRRKANGVRKLRDDSRLERAAQGHSNAMDKGNFFSHIGPGGSSPQSRAQNAGYMAGASSWGIAEVIRWGRRGPGSPKAAIAAWMKSPSHRSALLGGRYRHLGVGVALGSPTGGGEGNAAIYTATVGYRG
jgi:uncharacterized protein YkwD